MNYSTSTVRPATEKQVNWIKSMLDTKTVDEAIAARITSQIEAGLTTRDASNAIDVLKPLPWKPREVEATDDLSILLATIPVSRYAIPESEVGSWLTATDLNGNDHLFVAVQKGRYGASKGRLFLNRLHGGYGGFRTSRLVPEDSLTVAKFLGDRDNAARAAMTFGHTHNQCGVCGADLTDEESRRLALGPTCRQRFRGYAGV